MKVLRSLTVSFVVPGAGAGAALTVSAVSAATVSRSAARRTVVVMLDAPRVIGEESPPVRRQGRRMSRSCQDSCLVLRGNQFPTLRGRFLNPPFTQRSPAVNSPVGQTFLSALTPRQTGMSAPPACKPASSSRPLGLALPIWGGRQHGCTKRPSGGAGPRLAD